MDAIQAKNQKESISPNIIIKLNKHLNQNLDECALISMFQVQVEPADDDFINCSHIMDLPYLFAVSTYLTLLY